MHLTKSRFVAGIQCLKRLYLQVHHPDLAEQADEAAEAIMNQGQEIGLLAQKAFPGGVAIEFEQYDLSGALAKTRELIADPTVPAIFEATFEHEDVLVRIDILERRESSRWRLIEVKASTTVKDHYLCDVAIQRHVLAGCGLKLAGGCLMHLNRNYVYDGHAHNLAQLFAIEDLTAQLDETQKDLPGLLQQQRCILGQGTAPDIEPGPQCTNPVGCEFYGQCNLPLPEDHISFLPGIRQPKLASFAEQGIERIPQLPEDAPLTERQRRACDCVQNGTPWFGEDLCEELAGLEYPLYFMDFETLNPALPRFAGMRPFDQLPFQWSVHVQPRPGAELEHYEFLAEDDRDPRPAFADSLCRVIGENGHIVVYSESFESTRLADLARWLPEYAARIENIQGRLWDLLRVIREHVYHAEFRGSYSLKSVLPALVPEMTYEGMEVADGTGAGLAWEKMLRSETDAAEKERLRCALLAYCGQDTLAMVRLLERLERECSAYTLSVQFGESAVRTRRSMDL